MRENSCTTPRLEGDFFHQSSNACEDKLVILALERIKCHPSQFHLFINMLRDTKGMDLIVTDLSEGELNCSRVLFHEYFKVYGARIC